VWAPKKLPRLDGIILQNQDVAAARLGAKAHFVGSIGDDPLGKIALGLYATQGVDASHLVVSREFPTGVGFIIVNPEGKTVSCLIWGLTSGSTEPL
jgi:sugar/nucleoside kinase (ribokinase family)